MTPDHGQTKKLSMVSQFFEQIRSGSARVVDLTHTLTSKLPCWPGDSPFHASVTATHQNDGYFVRNLTMPEHSGTHLDAPVHFDPGGLTVDCIPAEKLLAPGVVVDVSSAVKTNVDYRVTAQDVESWTMAHGAIPSGAVVFFRTGWAERWPSQENYMNAHANGIMHFPGLSVETGHYLLESAHPVGIGIDTASIDYGPSEDFPVHHTTLSAGLYHLENVANLDLLPAAGFIVITLPLKLGGGSGAPARVIAFIPSQSENLG